MRNGADFCPRLGHGGGQGGKLGHVIVIKIGRAVCWIDHEETIAVIRPNFQTKQPSAKRFTP